MKKIELIGGHKALVDDEDYEWLINDYVWFVRYGGIDLKYTRGKKKKYSQEEQDQIFTMHKLIMEKHYKKSNLIIDHIDHDGLNNQKYNLRYATHSQNMANTRKHSINTSSRYKGISFDKQRNRWCMNVTLNGKIVAHRKFLHEREAAIAYDIKSKEFFGEFSCVNISDASKEEIEKINEILKNPKKNYNCSSKYLGVHKNKKNRWLAQFKIIKDGKRYSIHIGSFKEELDAAKAYNIYIEKNNDFKKRPSNDIEISHLDRERIESYIFGNKIIENPLSKYLNVTKMRNKWQTSISINKKRVHIGTYNTEKEAAIAYNKKAIELFGDEAKLNIIEN